MTCLTPDGYARATEIRTSGVNAASWIRQASAIPIAIDNALQLIRNYKKQRDAADKAMRIAESEQAHLRDTYWPRELAFLEEFGTAEELEQADVVGRRIAGRLVSTIAAAFAKEMNKLDCNASRYCTSTRSKQVQDLLLVRSQAIANARILGRIMGFYQVQEKSNTNFVRRMNAVGLGKGLMDVAAGLYSTANKTLQGIGADLSLQVSQSFRAVGRHFGDWMGSEQTSAARTEYAYQRQSGGVPSPWNPYTNWGQMQPAQFAMHDSLDSLLAGMGYGNPAQMGNDPNLQNRISLANAWNMDFMGPNDKARSGSYTYEFTDSRGDKGQVTVNMDDFPLEYVDNKWQGDT